mmetsp:Transcript_25655/g.56539  ORF Transcript_25655/g.56539 Transcript_25655/m.56539 type:complete len:84 (+) Transcript_25655:282-533(+)
MESVKAAGLIGLAFPSLKNVKSQSFIESLYSQKLINDKVFYLGLSLESDESYIIFGSDNIKTHLETVNFHEFKMFEVVQMKKI